MGAHTHAHTHKAHTQICLYRGSWTPGRPSAGNWTTHPRMGRQVIRSVKWNAVWEGIEQLNLRGLALHLPSQVQHYTPPTHHTHTHTHMIQTRLHTHTRSKHAYTHTQSKHRHTHNPNTQTHTHMIQTRLHSHTHTPNKDTRSTCTHPPNHPPTHTHSYLHSSQWVVFLGFPLLVCVAEVQCGAVHPQQLADPVVAVELSVLIHHLATSRGDTAVRLLPGQPSHGGWIHVSSSFQRIYAGVHQRGKEVFKGRDKDPWIRSGKWRR